MPNGHVLNIPLYVLDCMEEGEESAFLEGWWGGGCMVANSNVKNIWTYFLIIGSVT